MVCALLPPLGQGSRYSSQSGESNKFMISSFSCHHKYKQWSWNKKIRHIYNCSGHVLVSELDGKRIAKSNNLVSSITKQNKTKNKALLAINCNKLLYFQYLSCYGPKFLKHFSIIPSGVLPNLIGKRGEKGVCSRRGWKN